MTVGGVAVVAGDVLVTTVESGIVLEPSDVHAATTRATATRAEPAADPKGSR